MAPTTRFWLAVGTPENWYTAFDYGYIWGLKASQRRYWEALAESNDIVFFYATTPVAGVVGCGIVRTRLHQNSPLWPEERARNEVIWPLRFEFDVLKSFPPESWQKQKIVLAELKARARSGFQSLEGDIAQELLRALPSGAPRELLVATPVGLRARLPGITTGEVPAAAADPHGHTQWLLAEIGRFQRYVADTEYPLEIRRLDVVWRRVQRSVPSFVFEVQISGNLVEAMGKLKQAFDLWNSNIFLVGKEEHHAPTNQLLGGTFHEIQHRLRFVELAQVEDLYQRKRAYRELESQLGILA